MFRSQAVCTRSPFPCRQFMQPIRRCGLNVSKVTVGSPRPAKRTGGLRLVETFNPRTLSGTIGGVCDGRSGARALGLVHIENKIHMLQPSCASVRRTFIRDTVFSHFYHPLSLWLSRITSLRMMKSQQYQIECIQQCDRSDCHKGASLCHQISLV